MLHFLLNLRFLRRAKLGGAAGFSLDEVMIALAITSVAAVSVTQLVSNQMQTQRMTYLKVGKAKIVSQLEEGINYSENIRASMTYLSGPNFINNWWINRCVTPGTTCPAQFVGAANMKPFDLISRNTDGSVVKLSGYWSKDGFPSCLPPTATTCPFQTRTYFYFSCPTDRATGIAPAQCVGPSQINLVFQIVPTPPVPAIFAGMNFYYPGTNALLPNPGNIAYRMSVASFLYSNQSCGAGQYVNGYDQAGHVICACSNHQPVVDGAGNPILDALNRPTCQTQNCPYPQLFIGYNMSGSGLWSPICVTPGNAWCYQISSFAIVQGPVQCPAGFYLAQSSPGQCYAGDSVSKTGISGMASGCGPDVGTCCTGNY